MELDFEQEREMALLESTMLFMPILALPELNSDPKELFLEGIWNHLVFVLCSISDEG